MGKFFSAIFDKFSALLLCKIYVFDIFNMVNFLLIFVISQSTKILIVSNFFLEVYT